MGLRGIVYFIDSSVFLVDDSRDESSFDLSDTSLHADIEDPLMYALKVQVPSAPWEFYVLSQLFHRLSITPQILKSIVQPYSCHLLDGESCLMLSFGKHGTLLDCVNSSSRNGGSRGLDEVLVAFFTVEILQTILAVHEVGVFHQFNSQIIHGDLKIDNVLLRLDLDQDWSTFEYNGGGHNAAGPWDNVGVQLIDWGVSIDMNSFEEGQMFKSGKKSDASTDCWAVRNELEWSFDIDWYGVASIIHVMFFGLISQLKLGTYMTVREETFTPELISSMFEDRIPFVAPTVPRLVIASSLKRYWNVGMWKRVFEFLLNAGYYERCIACDGVRREVERAMGEVAAWLKERDGRDLRSCLRKLV